jgi:hypothetical protein
MQTPFIHGFEEHELPFISILLTDVPLVREEKNFVVIVGVVDA